MSARFCVPVPVMVRAGGAKAMLAVTSTAELAGVYPAAVAVMLDAPRLMPVIVG